MHYISVINYKVINIYLIYETGFYIYTCNCKCNYNVTANTTVNAIIIIITKNAEHIYIKTSVSNCCILMQINNFDSLNQDCLK